MKHLLASAIIISMFLLFSACSDNNNDPSETAKQILPTAVGNYWNYDEDEIDEDGNITEHNTYQIKINGDTVINNNTYYLLAQDDDEQMFFRNTDDGIYTLYFNDDTKEFKDILMFKYPAKAGDIFIQLEDDTVNVVATNISVTVPAGTFNCYHYKINREYISEEYPEYSEKYIQDIYACPGVGIIKIVYKATKLNGEFIYHTIESLTSYHHAK